jgi:hypothetical protein
MIITDVHITRTLLSMGPLNLNDRVKYRWVSLEPGQQKWRRQVVSSPFVDGSFTTHRSRDRREPTFVVDVMGSDESEMSTHMADLLEAFSQDTFQLGWTIDGEATLIQGEAADYQMNYENTRVAARRRQVAFTLPIQPIPITGSL